MRASTESFANGWSSGSGGRVFQASYSSDVSIELWATRLVCYLNSPVCSICILRNIQNRSSTTPKIYHELQTSTKIIYIYFLSSGQASKQAGPLLACWLAQIRPFGLLACLITNSVSLQEVLEPHYIHKVDKKTDVNTDVDTNVDLKLLPHSYLINIWYKVIEG